MKDRLICHLCLTEPFLQRTLPAHTAECSYCEQVQPCTTLGQVAQFCSSVLQRHFTTSHMTDAVALYGRTPAGLSLYDTLQQLGVVVEHAMPDLCELARASWAARRQLELRGTDGVDDTDDPWFEPRHGTGGRFSHMFRDAERSLRIEARHNNPKVQSMLDGMFADIDQMKTADGRPAVVVAGPGQEIAQLMRARVFQREAEAAEAIAHPAKLLSAPPPHSGRAGRMNAKGQPAFYGATMPLIALAEVRPPVGAWVVIGRFELLREVRLLDLRSLVEIQLDPTKSLFDPLTLYRAEQRDFLRTLAQRIAKPVLPDDEEYEYLITQVIADHLAMREPAIDGVIYPSVQASADDGTAGGVNVVLFHAASRTQDAAGPALGSAQLWREDSASMLFAPWLEPSPQAVKCGDSQRGFQHEDEFDAREITLRAIPAGTTVHRVKGNRVLTDWKAVSIGRRE